MRVFKSSRTLRFGIRPRVGDFEQRMGGVGEKDPKRTRLTIRKRMVTCGHGRRRSIARWRTTAYRRRRDDELADIEVCSSCRGQDITPRICLLTRIHQLVSVIWSCSKRPCRYHMPSGSCLSLSGDRSLVWNAAITLLTP